MFEDLNEVVKKFGEKKVRQALEMWREYYEAARRRCVRPLRCGVSITRRGPTVRG
ncbi:MAG: hypothetical protein ACYSW3_28300 [Planctomycetota bacterium]|jgi:hypothetical protein